MATPMGDPISGLIAEAALQELERVLFTIIYPKVWKHYDHTFVIIKEDNLSVFHQLLSTRLPRITFTTETAG